MTQAADRRQLGATSTPPSLPAPGWRRDLPEILIERAPLGAFCVEGGEVSGSAASPRLRPPDRPAAVMLLAPALGLIIWMGLFTLIF